MLRSTEIRRRRLAAQHIVGTTLTDPAQVVAALGAIQAQDYLGALWAIGLRMVDAREPVVEDAIAARQIVRTWPMRGTLHFVAAADARWLVELLAPRSAAKAAARLRSFAIDGKVLARAERVLARVAAKPLARPAVYAAFERARIACGNGRGIHLLWRLAHDGLICFGPRDGKQPTFVLFDAWLPAAPRRSRDEALGELAARYFAGHGPATAADFAWWSGLALGEARRAIAIAGKRLAQDGEHWLDPANEPARIPRGRGTLLPAFDEYLVGYTDRSAVLDPAHTHEVNAGGGILRPTIVVDGVVVGTWQRRLAGRAIKFELQPIARWPKRVVEAAMDRYTAFVGR